VLAGRGITRLLVEGGAKLATSFFRAGLVDRLAWFRAGKVLGGDALPAFGPLGRAGVAEATGWKREAFVPLGDDALEIWTPPT
jgi:diaminohydroxyphosphoribosylaminopyrimidine deaminase / 5-amino-6-(5-phosphoribosylamino)uracil reductase